VRQRYIYIKIDIDIDRHRYIYFNYHYDEVIEVLHDVFVHIFEGLEADCAPEVYIDKDRYRYR